MPVLEMSVAFQFPFAQAYCNPTSPCQPAPTLDLLQSSCLSTLALTWVFFFLLLFLFCLECWPELAELIDIDIQVQLSTSPFSWLAGKLPSQRIATNKLLQHSTCQPVIRNSFYLFFLSCFYFSLSFLIRTRPKSHPGLRRRRE